MNTYSWPFIIARRFRFRLYRLLRRPIPSHNVLWHGADPTGKMDSVQAIQNSIDTVMGAGFPPGTYIVTGEDDNGSIYGQENTSLLKREGTMAIELTEEQFKQLFQKYPQVRKAEAGEPCCPFCGNAFSPENLRYYNQCTDSGTDCCAIEITCDICNRIIWRGGSWYPGIEDADELLCVAEEVLDERVDEPGKIYW